MGAVRLSLLELSTIGKCSHLARRAEKSVNAAQPATASASPKGILHVLTVTPFYPTVSDDASGCFIAEPLQAMTNLGVKNSVLAVAPAYRRSAAIHPNTPPAKRVRYLSLPGRWGLASAGALLFPALLAHVRRLHKASPVDLIHAHAPLPCGHAALLLSRELGIPYVVSVHGLDAYSTRQVSGRPGEWCRRVSRLVFQSAKRVLCISEHVREQVLLGSATARTAVVFNGVDPERFSPSQRDLHSPPRVISVGNLIPIKGHTSLLRAIAATAWTDPQLECEIIGDGPEMYNLRTLAEKLQLENRVRFLGRESRQQVANRLRVATLFALPSTYEGLGCVYLEAMACGKAVIGCRGQGIEEVIQHGVNGWLVGPDNVEELALSLGMLLHDSELRARIGLHARNTILQGFTLDHQARQLLRIYRECVA
jgi:teichuronic acid biosynthesis glycosyltransferase TuaC